MQNSDRNLWATVLHQAIEDLSHPHYGDLGLVKWFYSQSLTLGSFRFICQALEIPAKDVILKYEDKLLQIIEKSSC